MIADNPPVVLDGACNTAAMKVVRDYVNSKASRDKAVAVVGMCGDKQAGETLSILGEAVGRFICTRAGNPREMPPEELARKSPEGVEVLMENDPLKALDRAVMETGPDGFVIVTGSLYLVGSIIAARARESIEQL